MAAAFNEQFEQLQTPCLILDKHKALRNCDRMLEKVKAPIELRPHCKTLKSKRVVEMALTGSKSSDTTDDNKKPAQRICVSTIAEVAYFWDNGEGYHDILYAVGIEHHKIAALSPIVKAGCKVTLITDNLDGVKLVNAAAQRLDVKFPVLVEVDVGQGRGGVLPTSGALLEIAHYLHEEATHLTIGGVLTHGGHSYACKTEEELLACAESERLLLVEAAGNIRGQGMPCEIVSAGSTPTVSKRTCSEGLTECRAGVYVCQDLDQAGIGSCSVDDVALTVLTTVIGHNKQRNSLVIDAGGLALSKDISASQHKSMSPIGYGLVAPKREVQHEGGLEADHCHLYVSGVSQEHGMVMTRGTSPMDFERYPVGSRLHVLPHHACFTAAPFTEIHVWDPSAEGPAVDSWSKCTGWF